MGAWDAGAPAAGVPEPVVMESDPGGLADAGGIPSGVDGPSMRPPSFMSVAFGACAHPSKASARDNPAAPSRRSCLVVVICAPSNRNPWVLVASFRAAVECPAAPLARPTTRSDKFCQWGTMYGGFGSGRPLRGMAPEGMLSIAQRTCRRRYGPWWAWPSSSPGVALPGVVCALGSRARGTDAAGPLPRRYSVSQGQGTSG